MSSSDLATPRLPRALLLAALLAAPAVVTCGGGGGGGGGGAISPAQSTGNVTVTLSDPPTCKSPGGEFHHVWVTVTEVRAHLSETAEGGDGGWVTLVDLTENPVQIDLLSGDDTACVLATLGANSGLPAGDYQQIRLHLLANNPGGGADVPVPNACQSVGAFNCVDTTSGLHPLVLSSQANNGLKIPSGQIAGGKLQLEGGAHADVNIDFDACKSIVKQGNGTYRLKPTLHAAEIVSSQQTIRGRVVDATTNQPIVPGEIVVALERRENDRVDRIVAQRLVFADGTFTFCPVPPGTFDVVVSGRSASGRAYGPTVAFRVPAGAEIGLMPLHPQPVTSPLPGRIEGIVSSSSASLTPVSVDVEITALQPVSPPGEGPVLVTVPAFSPSTSLVMTEPGAGCPAQTLCAPYLLIVPAQIASAGVFSETGTVFTTPPGGAPVYGVSARAFATGTGTPTCIPPAMLGALDAASSVMTVFPGGTTTAAPIPLAGCSSAP